MEQLANDVQTVLTAKLSAGGLKAKIESAAGFPGAASYRIRIDNEFLIVTAGAGTAEWTVTRGAEGTAAVEHAAGSAVVHVLTAGAVRAVIEEEANRVDAVLGSDPDGGKADLTARLAAMDLVLASAGSSIAAAQAAIEAEVKAREAGDAARLAKAENLKDLANVGTARTNLGLGSAALQASGAFDAAGAAAAAQAAAIAASQPLDPDLTAIAALATDAFGLGLLTKTAAQAVREYIATNSLVQFEESVWRQGMPEKFWPTLWDFRLWKPNVLSPTANSTHLLRFKAPRDITARGLSFATTTAATNNDNCAVVMKDSTGKKTLASSGSVAGKLNAAVARQDVDFTADVLLEAGKVFYAGFQYSAIGGTAAALLAAETQNGNSVAGMFGTAAGAAQLGAPVTTFPWEGEPAFAISQTRVYLLIRER